MKRSLILLLIINIVGTFSYAQEFEGNVLDEKSGKPLENVKVTDLNSGKTSFTNEDGKFEFGEVKFPLELEFKRIGYLFLIKSFQENEQPSDIFLQREISQLSEVIVRSSNIPQEIRKIPASVSLISENDLKRTDNFNLVQNFNYVPGVFVSQGALNTNKINIRGIGSRAQYSTNRIKAYINGIPLTTAEGELTLDDFDPEYLDRIEIIKGPVSSAFGAGLGGAINLYTKNRTRDQRSVVADFSYGSFNTRKTRANINYVKDSLDLSFNYNQVKSDGYRENGEYDRISMLGSANLLNKKGNSWSFFFSYTNLKAYIPSSLNEDDFLNDSEKAAFTWYQAAGYESYTKNILGISYEHNFSESFKNQTSLFYNSRDGYEPRPFDILDDDRKSFGARTRFNYKTAIFSRASEISFGAETMFENYETGTYENLYEEAEERRSILGDRLSLNEQDRNYLNLFAQLNIEITSKLSAEAGLNFNTTAYNLNDKFNSVETNQSGDYRFEPVLSPRLGLSYEAFEGKNFYASASHGFSTPTVAETLTPEGLINTDLKTETGWNYEIGFKGNWLNNRLYTELNFYSIQIRNLLVARRVGQDQYVGVNAGKADHNGIEFTSAYETILSGNLVMRFFLNSSFNFFEFDRFVDLGENYSGNTIPGVPEYMISPGTEFSYKNLSANINFQAFGEMALNDANSGYTDPYQLLNLKLDYYWNLSRKLDLNFNFGINNILDEKYASSIVTNAIGFGGSAPRYYYPGNPRNFFGGLRLNFNL
ncbi:iron complex outermembrane receptor protein [Christiangramia gaetbulicola]|uniref:Iron complex outermembrane receptor protein n=1 Tax=Christiangramia gaetbulicola TaxID=703340 RepID=A0A2T6AE81_9FLAO|nr:TonB-dependent receptor [Christiangramia gaetbulicola]PTX42127.1 iron complex outermembrane receptor protein [Christiangramia gaetbulicola]